MLKHCKELI